MSKVRPLFNFFALIGEIDTPALLGVHVTAELQQQLSQEFARQLQAFGLGDADLVPYTPQYRPEEGELFQLKEFTLPASVPQPAQWPSQPGLGEEDIEKGAVRALLGVPQGMAGAVICFQAVDARQMLKRSRLSIILTNDTFARSKSSGLVVREHLSAVLRDGSLYFPSEAEVKRFLDLTPFSVAATAAQVDSFFGHAAFVSDDHAHIVGLADKWIRRKVTSIEAQGILDKVSPQDASRIARGYGVAVETRRSAGRLRIVLPSVKKELKSLLRFLDQDFLDSQLTSDHFQVNSKRKV